MDIALLRGINVGKGKPLAMADLQALMAALGFAGARTLLRTGNVVFDGGGRDPAELEALLERELKAQLRLETLVFVRSGRAWAEALAHNPFPEAAVSDPAHLVVFALKQTPPPADLEALRAAITGPEQVAVWDRHAYAIYPEGIAESKLTPALLSRWLTPGAGRNWNTAQKLAAMAKD